MAGRHIRYNVAGKYLESSTTGDATTFSKLDLSGHTELVDKLPVGCVYTNITGVNPATELGYGTWVVLGAGRCLVGYDAGQVEFNTVRKTGGAKTHTLVTGEMPAHTHTQDAHTHTQNAHTHTQDSHTHLIPGNPSGTPSGTAIAAGDQNYVQVITSPTLATTATNQNTTATNQNTTATNQNTGGGGAHNNLQPYYTVHFWERTV